MTVRMNKIVKKEVEFNGKTLSLETGSLAWQSNMAVKATYGDTVVLVTVTSSDPNPDLDYFPLSVSYDEKLYASGSIKSSRFVKRDGKPTDEAVVIRRMIDHAIRPLFPNDLMDEVQIVATVLSLDEEADPEFLAMVATSAALHASDIPWAGPMMTVRMGYIDGQYVINPTNTQLDTVSKMNMMISFAGEDKKFLAAEAEIDILPDNVVLGAMEHARNNIDPLMKLIAEFSEEANPGIKKYEYKSSALNPDVIKDVEAFVGDRVEKIMEDPSSKLEASRLFGEMLEEIYAKFEGKYKKVDMASAFANIEKKTLRNLILRKHQRLDGRGIKEVRPISSQVGVLPRVHGSGLFMRGETQALTIATLGSPSMEMLVQDMYGEKSKKYMHFYNMPPYASGEVGKLGSPGGREIGHGMLAEKALKPVIPSQKEFPYTIILVSEILSSAGSTSMAATCGSTLAMMDAGVPIKDMVAGISVGLIVNEDQTDQLVMTDLAYMEDAFGYLDYKMAGTAEGVTAIQVDMKLKGIPFELLPKIFDQSKEGRLHVLEEMKKTISAPRSQVSQYAPKSFTYVIDPDQIGMIIGSGGKTIKAIEEKTGATLSIDPDGTVVASSVTQDGAKKAIDIVEGMTKEIKIGEIYEGEVKSITDFGAFVEILPGREGLLHISELAHGFVNTVEDVVKVGDMVQVKVLDVNEGGNRITLSKKALEARPEGDHEQSDRGSQNSGGRGQRHGGGDRGFRRNRPQRRR